MNTPLFFSRLLGVIFFAAISYSLTGNIAVKSTMGIISALIGLGAACVFFYLLPKLYQQHNEEDNRGA